MQDPGSLKGLEVLGSGTVHVNGSAVTNSSFMLFHEGSGRAEVHDAVFENVTVLAEGCEPLILTSLSLPRLSAMSYPSSHAFPPS